MNMISLMKDIGIYKKEYPLYDFIYIDNFNKKYHVIVMKNKDIDPIYDAFMESFKIMGYPQPIYGDDEGNSNSNKL